jgi:hypothetical protein
VFAEDIESDFADIESNAGSEAGIELEVGDADEMHNHAGECCGASGGIAVFFDFAAPAFVATEFLAQDVDGGFPQGFFAGVVEGGGFGKFIEAVGEVAVIGGEDGEGFLGWCVVGQELLGDSDFGGVEGDHGWVCDSELGFAVWRSPLAPLLQRGEPELGAKGAAKVLGLGVLGGCCDLCGVIVLSGLRLCFIRNLAACRGNNL